MDYSSKEGCSYFATIAESYDRLQPILSPPYSKGLEMVVELIPFDPDDTFEFVELGCGTAEPTMRVLERFRNASGTCVNNEAEMLSLARKKLSSLHPLRRDANRTRLGSRQPVAVIALSPASSSTSSCFWGGYAAGD